MKNLKGLAIMLCALILAMFAATDTAMAMRIEPEETPLYICGKEITGDTASGTGWRFERAKEDDEYSKLYLNNATLTVDDSTVKAEVEGQAIEMWDELEIILTGNNTINMNVQNLAGIEYYDAICVKDIIFSGQGGLTIKYKDYESSGAYIATNCICSGYDIEIKDGVKLNVEGPTITKKVDDYSYCYGIACDYNLTIGSNAEVNISGLGVKGLLEEYNYASVGGVWASNVDIAKDAKVNIVLNDTQAYDTAYCAIWAYESVIIDDNSQIAITLGKLKGYENEVSCICTPYIALGNNVDVDIKIGDVIGTDNNTVFAIFTEELVSGDGLDMSIDMGTIDGDGFGFAVYAEGILQIGNDGKLVAKGGAFSNPSDGDKKRSSGVVSMNITMGDRTTIDTSSCGKCDYGCMFIGLSMGKDSIVKASGKDFAIVVDNETAPEYLAYGGVKVNDTNELAYKEMEFEEEICYTYYNGTIVAKYVEIGPLLTITLKCDNGTVDKTSFTMHNGHAIGTLPTPVSSRKDYTFAGWYTAATGGSKVYSTTKLTQSTTLYAQWKKITYTINFDGNGGTVGVEKKWVEYGNPMEFMPTPKREGYTFTGWYTAATGGSKVYSTTKPTKSMTLYAQWKKITYTINFNANGGTVGVEKKWVEYGNPIEFMPTPKREGYTFTGWYTAATGGSKVYSTTKPTKSMTLYAQWKINTYTIKFDGNGGTVGVEKKWVDHGNAMNFMPTPKRDGYTFTGWYTAASGGSKVYSTTKVTKNMTLYAQWKKK